MAPRRYRQRKQAGHHETRLLICRCRDARRLNIGCLAWPGISRSSKQPAEFGLKIAGVIDVEVAVLTDALPESVTEPRVQQVSSSGAAIPP